MKSEENRSRSELLESIRKCDDFLSKEAKSAHERRDLVSELKQDLVNAHAREQALAADNVRLELEKRSDAKAIARLKKNNTRQRVRLEEVARALHGTAADAAGRRLYGSAGEFARHLRSPRPRLVTLAEELGKRQERQRQERH